jgi:hypothetical protein
MYCDLARTSMSSAVGARARASPPAAIIDTQTVKATESSGPMPIRRLE